MKKSKGKYPNRMKFRRLTAVFMAVAVVLSGMALPSKTAEAAETEYEIYPSPHVMDYEDGSYIINTTAAVNVVYESGIDEATKARLNEVLALKSDITVSESDEIVEGATNILVGIDGSGEYVDTYADKNITVSTESLFDELDSYVLESDDGVITVLGADTDASFYGLTTLYHIFKQMDSYTIRNFHIEDWADVASRGFIEGYYGNPWSTEDRMNLMTWGGYYKLNSYFYAPKNDPKHNSSWRELYTDEEIETLIKPLADAGNASKCRFVYALHPFMYSPISFASEAAYQEDLKVLQAKFEQVINAGVRQIAILADDAANYNNTGNLGGNNYARLLNDMTIWLSEMKKTYPDLKMTLPFCTVEYYGNGESYYSSFPENVQIVMTGGRIWGEVSDSFTSTFTSNAGRGPYMWVNWPCTDNSKNHLIMGGYSTFLHPGVDPDKIQGIVLNPMQQSEPSKVAIFGNACYSWNIWDSADEADQAWNDSFKYVDHNSAIETDASNALRELSKHMINQNMDSRVTALQESVKLAPLLTEFKDKLNTNTVTEKDVDALISEFEVLQEAADVYEAQAGDTKVRDQIVYWLDCWDDTTDAAIAYLNGVKAVINNDTTAILQYNTEGKTAFDNSKTHALWYLDHYEYAEVGVQHIVPFIEAAADYVSKYAETAMNPDAVIRSFITNRKDTPVNGTDVVFDGDDSTFASYRSPNYLYKDDYVGVLYNRPIEINSFRFRLGNEKNHFYYSKFQYTTDGETWKDMEFTGRDNEFNVGYGQWFDVTVDKEMLPADFQAMGIRLIATKDNPNDAYLNVYEIQVNQQEEQEPEGQERLTGTVTYDGISVRNDVSESKYFDGDNTTEVQLAKGPYEGSDREIIAAGSTITVTFDEPKAVGAFRLVQGVSKAGDVFSNADVEYQLEGSEDWVKAGTLTNAGDQTIDFGSVSNVKAVRIFNQTATAGWVRIAEIEILAPESGAVTPIQYNVIRTDRWTVHQGAEANLYDGNDDTYIWYDPDGSGNSTGDDFLEDDFIGYDFGKVADLESAHIVVGYDDGDKLMNYTIETSVDGSVWTPVSGYENYTGAASGKDTLDIDLTGTSAQYIRIRNLTQQGSWGKFSEFTVEEKISGSTENLYTNIDTNITAAIEEGIVSLSGGIVTLGTDDYIGVKLDNIKSVTGVTASQLPENTVLETSMNAIEWTTYASGDPVDARYIRVRSKADSTEVNLTQFNVNYEFVGEKSVDSDFGMAQTTNDMRVSDTVGNVFDGDLTTIGMINGAQEEGKHITFDLGQVVHFSSLRYYIVETQLNYLRNSVFEVSVDGDKWTEVLRVGKDTENVWDDTTAKDMQDITLKHDDMNPGYMYAEAKGLDVDGRYIRVTPVETYSHRWVGFSEIQINGGEYISPEVNRDVISADVEEQGKIPSNMLDGDYSTTYKSSAAKSSFTYRLSEPEGLASIRLIQLGQVSGAEVTAEYIGENGSESLGKLNQAINEFLIPEGKTLRSITVRWKDVIPEIAEIAVSTERGADVYKDALGEALKQTANEAWTTDSKEAYQAAWDVANEVYNNENASQTVVDSALGSLQSAYNNAEMKASNIDELQALVDGKVSNDNVIYTSVTYAAYESAVNKLAAALGNKDNLSQEDADGLKADVASTQAALEFSTRNRELAELETLKYAAVSGDNYTTASYAALTEAKNAIDTLAAQDKAAETAGIERVNPQEFIDARTAFQTAMDGLVDVTALKAAISTYESLAADKDLYTAESWTAYENAVKAGKELLEAGTQQQIKDALSAIAAANEGLVLKEDITVQDMIDAAEAILNAEGSADKYTTDSYTALAYITAEAKEKLDDESYIEKIQSAIDGLVNVEALKAQIAAAQNVDKDQFTTSSYKALADLLGQTDALLKSGSTEDVDAMTKAIDNAIRALEPRAAGVDDYRDSIILKPEKGYTADSYKAYKEAYEALMNADASDLSAEEFAQLKADFERAELALKTVSADKPAEGDKDKGNTAVATGDQASAAPIVIVLILCAVVIAAVVIIRKKRK